MAQRSNYATSLPKPVDDHQAIAAQMALRREMAETHPARNSDTVAQEKPTEARTRADETPLGKEPAATAIPHAAKAADVLAPATVAAVEILNAGGATSAPRDRFDTMFLNPGTLETYLAHIDGDGDDPRYLVATGIANFTADPTRVPLELCEYLAYKSVLAYERDKKALESHFDRCGWRGIKRGSLEFFDTGKKGDTQGFGFVSGDTAFVVMRGTTSATDWMNDLTTAVTTDADAAEDDIKVVLYREPRRHLGFARAWGHSAGLIEGWYKTEAQAKFGAKHLCFSGHSLGGALALIGAHDFAKRNIATADAVITFAAPKVGGPEFAADYDALGLGRKTLRCESPEDLVTWGSTHKDFANPGVSCLVDKRPMIAGMEFFWAAILGIAGWERAKEAAKAEEAATANKAGKDANADQKPATDVKAETASETSGAETKDARASPPDAAKPAGDKSTAPDGKGVIIIVFGLLVLLIVGLIGRRVLIRYRAHGAAKRYTLFFSTHAYRKIREARFPDLSKATDAELAAAAKDLSRHLDYIRGRDPHVPSFKQLRNRPVLALTQKDVQWYIAKTRDTGADKGGYWRYFW